MLAVISTGGKQYVVRPGDTLTIEKLPADAGQSVTFDQVMLVADDAGAATVGAPSLPGATVTAEVVTQQRDRKILVQKFHAKTRYRRLKGHRQHHTVVKITTITPPQA